MSEQRERTQATASLSVDVVLDLLSHRHRRAVLALFDAHGRKLTLNDLTKALVVGEHDAPITQVPGDELVRVSVSLHHRHLPKLASAGAIEYDPARRIAEPAAELDSVGHLLPRFDGEATLEMLFEHRD